MMMGIPQRSSGYAATQQNGRPRPHSPSVAKQHQALASGPALFDPFHRVGDALTGAAGLDDVGTLFPDTDDTWKGADSTRLLEAVVERVRSAGFHIGNVDVVIATEGPRIAPVRAAMRVRIGALLGVDASAVNVKGKTLEGLGALAEGRGVAVQAICLLRGGE